MQRKTTCGRVIRTARNDETGNAPGSIPAVRIVVAQIFQRVVVVRLQIFSEIGHDPFCLFDAV